MPDWRIPLCDLDFGPEEEAAVQRVLQSRWLSMGPEVQAFEREFASMQSARHAFAVSSATAGLHLALLALGIGPGDEVIQPALNFVAAANMTVAAGAVPVFTDITGLQEPILDPRQVECRITPRTRAVVVMHYGGNVGRMTELTRLCRERDLALIEDACHAIGAAYRNADEQPPHGRMAGSIGDIGAFSFFANKNLATGEGGMIVTDRDDCAEKIRLLRSHGMTTLTWDRHRGHASRYEVVAHGYNYRLDELHAALGRVQLARLAGNNERRRRLLVRYFEKLGTKNGWTIPFPPGSGDTSGHLMVILAPSEETRDRAMQNLREAGVQTSLHYPCVSDFKAFSRWQTEDVPLTREFSRRAITLPLFPAMTAEQVEEVCSVLVKI